MAVSLRALSSHSVGALHISQICTHAYSGYNGDPAGTRPVSIPVCRSSQMNIGKKKSEILRLIKRLESDGPVAHPTVRPSAGPMPEPRNSPPLRRAGSRQDHQSQPPSPTGHRRRDHLELQGQKLDEIKRRREKLATTLSSRNIEDALEQLEERVDRIESKLRTNVGVPSSVPAAQTPLPQTTQLQTQAPHALPSAPKYVIGGMLKEGFMSDLLQLISSNEWNGTLVVGEDAERISLEFCEGEIWNATAPGATGESAVFVLMTRNEGPYSFTEAVEKPHERTIDGNTQFLILEGLRRIDEGGANAQEP